MPNKDQTGPIGQGPTTGRGFGRCGCANHGIGQSFSGIGRGFLSKKESLQNLEQMKENLQADLVAIDEAIKSNQE
jgi:hypothetical protein